MQDRTDKSLFGIDINEYTQNVQFEVLARTVDFLYLRSSGSGSGRFRPDKKFLEFAKESRNFGIPVGAYHFGVPSNDLTTADKQCDDFINILQQGFGEKDYGDLFPVLDVEVPVDKSITTKTLVDWIDRFRKRFEQKTRRRLMLYTGLFFIQLYDDFKVNGKQPLSNMPLWIAMYTNIPSNPPYPPNAGGWKRWRVWQYSENQVVKGVGNPVDANWGPDSIDLLRQPKQVEGFKAVDKCDKINLTWTKNKDVDLLGYNIFVNGSWGGTVEKDDTSFVINKKQVGAVPGKKLTISIEAFDYDGETSKIRSKVVV